LGSYSEGIRQVFKETRGMVKDKPKFKVGDKVICRLTSCNVSVVLDEVGVVKDVEYDYSRDQFTYGVSFGTLSQICYEDSDGMEAANPQDSVNHPSHYNQHGVECIEAIRASLGDEFESYCKGNIIKYVWRYKYKNGVEDLKKAQVYLSWMIEATTEND